MTDGVLIFTFSPVQSFIAEARRAADLYAGSQILVQLARAVAEEIGLQQLIYPAPIDHTLPGDVPNVIVARLPYDQAKETAQKAHQALLKKWNEIAESAKQQLNGYGLPRDSEWEEIWNRQIEHQWQVFWVVAALNSDGYSGAYRAAREALHAVKRSRIFSQVEERGAKDSLSGTREALHLRGQDAKTYWTNASKRIRASKLRPGGRERLDAIGAVKRFSRLAEQSFPSTSTIASADFREQARRKVLELLVRYRHVLEEVVGEYLYKARGNDPDWPYDGDLLFMETLTPNRLEDSYGGIAHLERLEKARRTLRDLYKEMNGSPSHYYAIIVFDGDGMGEHISELLKRSSQEAEHQSFSRKLAEFAREVPRVLGEAFREKVGGTDSSKDEQVGREFLVYNGGDDVLAVAPLSVALSMPQALARAFREKVPGCTASAGVAVVHHLYPLDAALRAAREAEQIAKSVPGKAAVAVQVLRRSGETAIMRSKWESMTNLFDELVDHFAEDHLSSRFAYDLSDRAPVVTALSPDARQAMLRQLVKRHKTDRLADKDAESLVDRLTAWSEALAKQAPPEKIEGTEVLQGLTELARWVVFARFVAQGGRE